LRVVDMVSGGDMYKVKGVYDGQKVVLLEPLPIPPQTQVEVSVVEETVDPEQAYWQQLVALGLIRRVQTLPTDEQPFTPVRVTGKPVSQTVVEERR
jgi:hypothetical protein